MAFERPAPVAQEREFGIGELFFSTTDEKGIITAGNAVFTRISGYQQGELLGQPHNVIRHPDMPRCVFKLLWDYLGAGKPIAAYVKNMAKTGEYYWVTAFAVPVSGGFLSIRLKPTSPILALMPTVYAELLEIEKEHERQGPAGKKPGMVASTNRLLAILKSKGFADYDAFMHTILVEEVRARDAAIAALAAGAPPLVQVPSTGRDQLSGAYQHCQVLQEELERLFGNIAQYQTLSSALTDKSKFVGNLAHAMQMLALNATVEAGRLQRTGAPLAVIAQWMGFNSSKLTSVTQSMSSFMAEVTSALRVAAFEAATAKLELQTTTFFLNELIQQKAAGIDQDISTRGNVTNLLSLITRTVRHVLDSTNSLNDELRRLDGDLETLLKLIKTLGMIPITGKVEAVRLTDAEMFVGIFNEGLSLGNDARTQLEELSRIIANVEGATLDNTALERSMQSIEKVMQ